MTRDKHVDSILKPLKSIWGYDDFRPHQQESIQAILEGRDSLTILPTGGGKSLIYQLPVTIRPGMAVVISPLIALMQDQVRSLQILGIPCACFNSLEAVERIRQNKARMFRGELKLIYISPERLLMDHVLQELSEVGVLYFAIDEAHCISQWGHDFRPEYTQLNILREQFPDTPIHAFTATAPPRIQHEITEQLKLKTPKVLIGNYFRPNLTYRVFRRNNIKSQLLHELEKFPKKANGIIYCLTRRETEKISLFLNESGLNSLPYHAGLSKEQRVHNQERFSREEVQIMVATVAFGMGIDQSNIRYVIHLGMPKSLSHYQQESGRAGRDGLNSTCILFYSERDMVFWKRIIEEEGNRSARLHHLDCMIQYATSFICRHEQLVNHFGQDLPVTSCGACDICLGEIASVTHARETSKKILSAVYRVRQRFGGGYIAQVLTGSRDQKILSNGHHNLSVHGLLDKESKKQVHDWINQLESQKYLQRTSGEYPVMKVTEKGYQLMMPSKFGKTDDDLPVLLVKTISKTKKKKLYKTPAPDQPFDLNLFEILRQLRAELAKDRGVPAFMIFGDRSLQDMAAKKPTTDEELLDIFGVGQHKLKKFGAIMIEAINHYIEQAR
ncbi:MAG: DNA helicase RecQ [Acidobacteria bacterium]|nr:MAG: DNA helicase RecQ [Acidobacteriota bacterium]